MPPARPSHPLALPLSINTDCPGRDREVWEPSDGGFDAEDPDSGVFSFFSPMEESVDADSSGCGVEPPPMDELHRQLSTVEHVTSTASFDHVQVEDGTFVDRAPSTSSVSTPTRNSRAVITSPPQVYGPFADQDLVLVPSAHGPRFAVRHQLQPCADPVMPELPD